ncbi:MAG: Hsp20/alpha crystallin family protein [Sporolactobacillus sp.]
MVQNDPRQQKPMPPRNLMNDLEAFFQQNPFQDVLKSIDDFFENHGSLLKTFPVHLFETKQNWVVEAELPGVPREAIHIELLDSSLRIIVENDWQMDAEHKEKGTYTHERRFDHAERLIPIPYTIDRSSTRASFANGILKIQGPRFPKTDHTLTIE